MLSLFRSKQLSLTIELSSKMLWLHPDAMNGDADDPVLRGLVKISTPETRGVKALTITFEGTTYLNGAPGGREKVCTIRQELLLPFNDGVLRTGDHVFDFAFAVPSSTAVTNYPVSLGESRHFVIARLEFSSSAPAVETRTPVYLVALPGEPGSVPDPYEKVHDHVSPDLGSIRTFLKPTYQVEYREGTRPQLPPVVHYLQFIDGNNPKYLKENRRYDLVGSGSSWSLDGVYRVPDGDTVWSSTFDSSDARMRVEHTLGVEILYRTETPGNDKTKSLRIEFPVKVYSCVTLADSTRLPPYELNSAHKEVRKAKRGEEGFLCTCEYAVGELMTAMAQAKEVSAEAPSECRSAGDLGRLPRKI